MTTSPSERKYLSVTEINSILKEAIEGVPGFHGLLIKGEISSYKEYATAAYFDIKDDKSTLSCIIWRDNFIYLPFSPKVGDEVLIKGYLTVYVARGRYQFVATSIELFGKGNELLRLEELKKKLASEGLFDESRKRPIKEFPSKVGVIVGKGSAAESDLIKNLGRRWPLTDIYLFPSLVQGKEAPKDLLRAFKLSQKYPLDTLIIARGGGSNEDLSAFNDEALVRAVSTSKMPVISAVGHEIDVTLIDFVSDKRVSTPTGAAEEAVPDQEEIKQNIIFEENSLIDSMEKRLEKEKNRLESISSRPFWKNPEEIYKDLLKKVGDLDARLMVSTKQKIEITKERIEGEKKSLEALSPLNVINRGYSLTTKEDGTLIRSVADAPEGTILKTRVKDGIIESQSKGESHE